MTSRRKKELKEIGRRRALGWAALSSVFAVGAPYPALVCVCWLNEHGLSGFGGLLGVVMICLWFLSLIIACGAVDDSIHCPEMYASDKANNELDPFEFDFLVNTAKAATESHRPRERREHGWAFWKRNNTT